MTHRTARRSLKTIAFSSLVCSALCSGCVGTTGGNVVDFDAAAAGPADAHAGSTLDFTTDSGWQVSLATARLHVGAVYLEDAIPTSGSGATTCFLPGTYIAQVTDGLDVDLLSGTPQMFPTRGHGTTLFAGAGQVWLTDGAIDSATQPAVLTLDGTATLGSDVRPFTASISISTSNRLPDSGTSPFADPICKQRVVSPIPTDVQIEERGGLLLRIDPRLLFVNVDFSALSLTADGSGYAFSDNSSDHPGTNLYGNLRSAGRLYTFSWVNDSSPP